MNAEKAFDIKNNLSENRHSSRDTEHPLPTKAP